jgi:maltose O-acetyltransferase
MMGNKNINRRIKQIIFRMWLLTTSNPYKVADLWRKRGVPIGKDTCIYRDVIISGEGSEDISIGNNCVLTGCALIGHDASTNRYLNIKYGDPSPSLPIVIEDDCFIGYRSIILMGVTVGRGSIVGAGTVVTSDVPPNSIVAGNPAKIICSVDDLVKKRRKLFS